MSYTVYVTYNDGDQGREFFENIFDVLSFIKEEILCEDTTEVSLYEGRIYQCHEEKPIKIFKGVFNFTVNKYYH